MATAAVLAEWRQSGGGLGQRLVFRLSQDVEILVGEADLAAQCRQGVTKPDARLRLDRIRQNLADFGLGAAPMSNRQHPRGQVIDNPFPCRGAMIPSPSGLWHKEPATPREPSRT